MDMYCSRRICTRWVVTTLMIMVSYITAEELKQDIFNGTSRTTVPIANTSTLEIVHSTQPTTSESTLVYGNKSDVSSHAFTTTVVHGTSMNDTTTDIFPSSSAPFNDPLKSMQYQVVAVALCTAVVLIGIVTVVCLAIWRVKKKYRVRRSSSAILRQIEEKTVLNHHGGREAYNLLVENNFSSHTDHWGTSVSFVSDCNSTDASQSEKQDIILNNCDALTEPMGRNFSKPKDSSPECPKTKSKESSQKAASDGGQENLGSMNEQSRKETLQKLMNAAHLLPEGAPSVSQGTRYCLLETDDYSNADVQKKALPSVAPHSNTAPLLQPEQHERTLGGKPRLQQQKGKVNVPNPKPHAPLCQPMHSLPITQDSSKHNPDTVDAKDRKMVQNKASTLPALIPQNAINAGNNTDEDMFPMTKRSDARPAPLPRQDFEQKQNISPALCSDDSYIDVLPDHPEGNGRDSQEYDQAYDWLKQWQKVVGTLTGDEKLDAEPSSRSKDDCPKEVSSLNAAPLESILQSDALYYNCQPRCTSDNAGNSGKKQGNVCLAFDGEDTCTSLKGDSHSPLERIHSDSDSCVDDQDYYNMNSDWLKHNAQPPV